MDRVVENGYRTRQEVSVRFRVLRDAGYHGQAADMADDTITIIVDGGKRQRPLDAIPPR